MRRAESGRGPADPVTYVRSVATAEHDGVAMEERMRVDLRRAMKAHDGPAVIALRTALAAIANAEAVPDDGSFAPTRGELVDHPRRVLTPDDVLAVVRLQIDDRLATIAEIAAHGGPTADLSAQIGVLAGYLA